MTVDESYAYCEAVAKVQAKNFYLTFLLLSRPQRRAMCAIYAFMRHCDDLSDDPDVEDRGAQMAQWSFALKLAFEGTAADHPVWPAFIDTVRRYKIPQQYFHDMMSGVYSDLEPRHVETFDDLYKYCYNVASVVGLVIVHIFGFDSPQALDLAEKCGIAFQLTNILRDVREDAENGRIYWPAQDLAKFGVHPADLRKSVPSPALRKLLRFQARRARAYYEESAPLVGMVHQESRPCLRALIGIYSRLLETIAAADYDVLSQRRRVPTWEKVWILARSRFG